MLQSIPPSYLMYWSFYFCTTKTFQSVITKQNSLGVQQQGKCGGEWDKLCQFLLQVTLKQGDDSNASN